MANAYGLAHQEIIAALKSGGKCLDCGANKGRKFEFLQQEIDFPVEDYFGIEWNADAVMVAAEKGLAITQGDLNKEINFPDKQFRCVFGLSVLEHLLNPCRFLRECYRVLEEEGTLIVLTPNISTYFTIALLMCGKMPSSGPHPDSNSLIKKEELLKVSSESLQPDAEDDTPVHRHLVVFSYRVLKSYLWDLGFRDVKGYGFGLYPFPNFLQPVLEKCDPYHCHQMVFVARK